MYLYYLDLKIHLVSICTNKVKLNKVLEINRKTVLKCKFERNPVIIIKVIVGKNFAFPVNLLHFKIRPVS